MDAGSRVDMLLGDPKKAIVAMSLPIIASLVVAELNAIVDRAWCSGMGVEALAAISVIRPIYCVYVGLGSGLGVGVAAVISRYIGAGNPEKASSSAVQAVLLGIVIGLILAPVIFLIQPGLLDVIGSSDINEITLSYMTCFTVCLPLIIVNGTIGGVLNGQGAAGLSTAMMVSQAVANMILDPIFIYVLGLGLTGASAATMVSTALSLAMGLYFVLGRRTYLKIGRGSLGYDSGNMRAVSKAGLPQMLEFAVIYAMDCVLNMIIISCAGSEGLTVYSMPDSIVALMIVPGLAVESALVAVASSAYGQRDPDRMQEAFFFAMKFGIGIVLALLVVVELLPGVFISVFTYSDAMSVYRPQMIEALRIMALYAPLFSITPICSAYLQSMKHPGYSVVIAIVRNLIMIGMYLIGSLISLVAIMWLLDLAHLIGALIIIAVTAVTFRNVRSMFGSGQLSGV